MVVTCDSNKPKRTAPTCKSLSLQSRTGCVSFVAPASYIVLSRIEDYNDVGEQTTVSLGLLFTGTAGVPPAAIEKLEQTSEDKCEQDRSGRDARDPSEEKVLAE